MSRKIVHVVGTGTIGEPLIGLLCDFKEQLGIDEVTFHKNTPLTTDRSKVKDLIERRGARLTTHSEKIDGFNDIGLKEWEVDKTQFEMLSNMFSMEDEMKPADLFWWSKIFKVLGDIGNYSEKSVNSIRMMIYT